MPLSSSQQDASAAVWEPQAAESRLAQTAGASPSGVFTSDLSVSEYVLLGEAGFEPLGFVVGSSIYHVGLQIARWGRRPGAAGPHPGHVQRERVRHGQDARRGRPPGR